MVEQSIVIEWLSKADEDFSFAEANLHEGNSFYAQICFHFQQAAEKYLKAYILAKELPFERVHDLMHLLRTCVTHSSSLTMLREDCILLSSYYIETRYPVHWPTNYSREVAEQARMAANNIAQAVRSELNITAMLRPLSSSKGFTLVELAIVLVIVGILVGLGSSMVGVLTSAIKVRETKDSLDADVQAVTSYASSHNSIPNDTGATGFFSNCKITQDSWGRDFIYLFNATLYNATPTKDTICGRRSTTLTLRNCLTTNNKCAAGGGGIAGTDFSDINNIAFVVISKSDDANIQTIATDGAILASRAATGTVTTDANNGDIVRWVTLDELRSKVGCQGGPLKIVNNELPYGFATSAYGTVTIQAVGGVQNAATDIYTWCVQTAVANTAPAGLTFQRLNNMGVVANITNVTNLFQTNCSTYSTANWPAAGQLVISGTPTAASVGSNLITVFVLDANANQASKLFVLTINPAPN